MMRRLHNILAAVITLIAGVCAATFAAAETRLGLVIANESYSEAPLKGAANDGALVAETLRSIGFDVSEARDLDLTTLRRIGRDFVAKVAAAGDDAVAFVYFSGHAIQFAGANQLVPIGARLETPTDAVAETFSLNALLADLAASKAKIRIVAIDAPQTHPFVATARLARGPALMEATEGSLIAFASSPDESPPRAEGDYGAYASALMEMLREPGLTPDAIFARVKLRVHERMKGGQTPWHSAKLPANYLFLDRAPDAPAPAVADARSIVLSRVDVPIAYAAAIERDTIAGYREFIAAFPDDPLTKKIRARLAQKREALAWRRASVQRTREAFWTYRKWYPQGPHYSDAGYELVALGAPLGAPADFVEVGWDGLDAPVTEELVYFAGPLPPALVYEEIAPPPPPPLFLPPPIFAAPPPRPAPSPVAGMLPLIGLAAIPAVAVIPRLVRPAPPRQTVPLVRPVSAPPQPVVVNPPRGPGPGQIAVPGQQPFGAVPPPQQPQPGQIQPRPGQPVAAPPASAAVQPGLALPPGLAPPPRAQRPIGPIGRPRPGPPPVTGNPLAAPGQPPLTARTPVAPARPATPDFRRDALPQRPQPPVQAARPPGAQIQFQRPAPQALRPTPLPQRTAPPVQVVRPTPPQQAQRPPQMQRPPTPVVRAPAPPPAQPRPAPQRPRCVAGQNIPNCVR